MASTAIGTTHHVRISHPGALSLSPKIARTADIAIAREIFGRRLPPMHSRRQHEKPAGQKKLYAARPTHGPY
jgi:hypothetical protein